MKTDILKDSDFQFAVARVMQGLDFITECGCDDYESRKRIIGNTTKLIEFLMEYIQEQNKSDFKIDSDY